MIKTRSTKELGKLIVHERKAQGLTQTQLAGLSGAGITFLSNLENGKQTAELGKTLNVLAALGLVPLAERRGDE
ncbi:MAG: transcriptional regulator [Coriobacteriia bacterium]|nr:MAG: transcriptional regulator [Coriobacteriia bacterium]